ncbi:MAG: hypothetical protein ACFFD4_00955 [Candidatus Odinarchaeota archaeon]
MNKTLYLTTYYGRSFLREKILLVLLLLFPILLIAVAAMSAPDGTLPIELDGTLIDPAPQAGEVLAILNSTTALVFVASITSFFMAFQLKSVLPRLRNAGYGDFQIAMALVTLMMIVNLYVTAFVSVLALNWISPHDFVGYMLSLFLSSVIFSTIGLVLASLVDTRTFGLISILTLAVLDTAFLENPIYSRRYDEAWTGLMPAHGTVKMLFRSTFDIGTHWTGDLVSVLFYELVLILIYLVVVKKSQD